MNHKGAQTIETERLMLRPFKLEDAEDMYRNWASDPEVTKYLTWPHHENVEVTRAIIEKWMKESKDLNVYQWAIELKELGQVIGSLGAVKVNDNVDAISLGYCMGKDWWGQGLMPEAVQAVIRFFFEEVNANSVSACHDRGNPKSGRVMQKCGMTYEGIWRAGGRNNQGICDEVWYSILRNEYEDKVY